MLITAIALEHWTTEDDDFDTMPDTAPMTIDSTGVTSFTLEINEETDIEEDEHFILYLYDENGDQIDWLLVYIINNDGR